MVCTVRQSYCLRDAYCVRYSSSIFYDEKLPARRGLLSGTSKSTTRRAGSADAAAKIIKHILGPCDEARDETESPTGPDSHPPWRERD